MNKTKFVIGLLFLIAALLWSRAEAQTINDSLRTGPSIKFNAGLSAGAFDPNGNAVINIHAQTDIFFGNKPKGFYLFTYGNAQMYATEISSLKTQSMFAFFALGGGYRVQLPNRYGFDSYITTGIGFGIQTIPKPYQDEQQRMVEQSPMRIMGYVNGQFPIRWNGINHALIFQNGFDVSPGPLPNANSVSVTTYRYRSFVTLDITNFASGINLNVGLHAEKMLANGFTFGVTFDRNRFQINGIIGANFDVQPKPIFSGGFRLSIKI